MKKSLFIALLLMLSVSAFSQTMPTSGQLVYKNGKFYSDGVVLSDSQLMNAFGEQDYGSLYLKNKKMRVSGIVLMPVGAVVAGLGTGLCISGVSIVNNEDNPTLAGGISGSMVLATGVVACVSGVAILAAGIGLYCAGDARLKRLGASKSGVGFTVDF